MKQNERLLVYAVTGFLALILVIAVLFGGDQINPAKQQENSAKGLSDLLDPKPSEADLEAGLEAAAAKADAESKALAKQLEDSKKNAEQPLIARSQSASQFIELAIGKSRRDRTVRFVTVKRGDTLGGLALRWCGSVDPFLQEAEYLNEDMTDRKLRPGSEVALPWVDDEVLSGIVKARAPRTLVAGNSGRTISDGASRGGSSSSAPVDASADGWPTPSGASVVMPGQNEPRSSNARSSGASAVGTVGALDVYKVKQNDNLWKIAAKRYGKKNADAMVSEMKLLNPGLTDDIRPGQVFKLPAKAE